MEVRIISLEPRLNHPVKKIFQNAKFFQAVDLRGESPQELLDKNLITLNGFENLKNGRKYHHELSTAGAVGLVLSFLKILKSNTGPVLICEDDCIPSPKLPQVINEMLLNSSDFDMVVFGPLMYEPSTNSMSSFFKNFDVLSQYYWGNHALLFSSQGRQKAIKHLSTPVDVQLDALFSRIGMYADFKIIIQAGGEPLAKQSLHASTIQTNSACPMCDTSPGDVPYSLWSIILLVISFVFILSISFVFIFSTQSKCTDSCSDRIYCPKLNYIKRKR